MCPRCQAVLSWLTTCAVPPQAQAAALNAHAAAVVARAATKIASLVGDGAAIGDAFTTAQPLLWHASNAHCVTIMTTGFNDGIAKAAATDAAIAAVLRDVCSLFCLTQLEQVRRGATGAVFPGVALTARCLLVCRLPVTCWRLAT